MTVAIKQTDRWKNQQRKNDMSKDTKSRILHDFKKIARAIRILSKMLDRLYGDLKDELADTDC